MYHHCNGNLWKYYISQSHICQYINESSRRDVWNQCKALDGINPKEKYTLTRDNQEKRVDKFTCQRASEDCSASVPFLTEHSTKCRREITASEQGVCHTPSAITYSPAVRLHTNPSDWIEKSTCRATQRDYATVEKKCSFRFARSVASLGASPHH